jgi:hypothetical protein
MVERISAKQFVQSLYPSAKCKWVKMLPNEFVITVSFGDWFITDLPSFTKRKHERVEIEFATTAIGAWTSMRELINEKIMEKLNS